MAAVEKLHLEYFSQKQGISSIIIDKYPNLDNILRNIVIFWNFALFNPFDKNTDDEKKVETLLSELRNLLSQGDIPEESPFTQTVGSMISQKREEKGITRAHLAKTTGITQSSLAKYERAGFPDGAFPPIPKMALICMELNLDPRQVFLRIFPLLPEGENERDTWKYYMFRSFLGKLDLAEGEQADIFKALQVAMKKNEKLNQKNKHLQQTKKQLSTELDVTMQELRKLSEENRVLSKQTIKENGPDLKDPSRSENSTNETEAALTASTNHTKDGGD